MYGWIGGEIMFREKGFYFLTLGEAYFFGLLVANRGMKYLGP